MIVQASSSGYHGEKLASISLDGIEVVMSANEHDHYRGLHIVVIDPLKK